MSNTFGNVNKNTAVHCLFMLVHSASTNVNIFIYHISKCWNYH